MSSELIVPFWQEVNDTIEKDILRHRGLPEDFLQHPLIRETAFCHNGSDPRYMFKYNWMVEKRGSSWVHEHLGMESWIGHPDQFKYGNARCSPNHLQMLYHIVYWEEQTGLKISNLDYILEWGGGYGAMARLILKINPDVHYVMYDTPVFARLQQMYLGATLPDDYLCDIYDLREHDLECLERHRPQLIISTWALSESSPKAIELAASSPAFAKAPHVLLGFQANQEEFQAAGDIVTILNKYRDDPIENVTAVPGGGLGNWYASR